MISPLRPRTADLASRRARPHESNETALRFVPHSPASRGKEKDPGSAFGPESVPLATGLVPVVYWVSGPFPGPTPVQPDMRGKPFLRHSPDLISLPVWPASPVLD
jgi:hypothetical protein